MTSTASAGRKSKATGKAAPRTSGPRKSTTSAREKSGTGTRTAGRRGRSGEAGEEQRLHMHTAHPSIPVPYVTRADLSANVHAAESALPDVRMPPPERLAFYGGLGALAVAGAVEWPVAAAIGVATVIARRGRRGSE
ncbi:hypothetical protein GCM10018793_41390 [Streptomyces sulfonofaciens]|uniref:Uncharacterized protein n=1 Tax=Streptomyces sulfonofaciens TaxID=68272 RepID=A0A919L358_9ACTN|nr:hypothetical protein [Streptomyces sulfonofaciens]GHH82182.1 hypothetical protein GCM10018793_41390 [Streptomyces sulfonofaciens]